MINPLEFVSQVRKELQRTTWPTGKETMTMTIAVLVMMVCSMVYFFVADSIIYYCLNNILGIWG